MQDIVFYAVANETLGAVRDCTNVFHPDAPVLTIGVAVCLRMRLFASDKGAVPYPIASFDGITNWQWSMDSDFDRSTACKLVADANGISVHTVTDTVDGEVASFTEFVIPISNMNTEELAAWLGNDGTKSGLNGELVGYDNEGHSMFVLQIENFKVRNRVAGLGDPTALDQEIVTRTQAEQMIQTAVSSSAVTKQDKLGSGNAGTGISISGAGVISTANVPQSEVTGLSASLATKQDKLNSDNAGTGISISSSGIISAANVPQSAISGLSASLASKQNNITAGYRMALVSGSTVDQARYFGFEPAITASANQTTNVMLCAGKAYEIHATAANAKVLLSREEPPSIRSFGLDGHIELFVAGTGYVVTDSNVVLADPLEPDSVNNCTVRFHDGLAIISVEDHVAGYIVVYASGSTSGTLPYGIDTATQEYVAFDATLNGTTIDLSGSTANGEKHIVGNGYSETALTGEVDCGTSKFTVANLTLQDVAVNGGTMTLGDAFIPSGSTVSVSSGGGLNIEKVTGAGSDSVIDLGGTRIAAVSSGTTASASGCSFSGGISADNAGAVAVFSGGKFICSDCRFIGNTASGYGGALVINLTRTIGDLNNVIISGNSAARGGGLVVSQGASCYVSASIISGNSAGANGGGVLLTEIPSYLELSSTRIIGNSTGGSRGGGMIIGRTTCSMTDSVISGNIANGSAQDIYLNSGHLRLAGSNVIGVCDGAAGTVTISSGAIVDLKGNTNAAPIAPGGGITIYGGTEQNPTKILFSSGASGGSRAFEIGEITGSTITNLGIVLGATVTNTSGDADVKYSSDDGATVSSYLIVGSGTFEVPEGAGLLDVQSV
jgi:hypothetical protein